MREISLGLIMFLRASVQGMLGDYFRHEIGNDQESRHDEDTENRRGIGSRRIFHILMSVSWTLERTLVHVNRFKQ